MGGLVLDIYRSSQTICQKNLFAVIDLTFRQVNDQWSQFLPGNYSKSTSTIKAPWEVQFAFMNFSMGSLASSRTIQSSKKQGSLTPNMFQSATPLDFSLPKFSAKKLWLVARPAGRVIMLFRGGCEYRNESTSKVRLRNLDFVKCECDEFEVKRGVVRLIWSLALGIILRSRHYP